jgi:hypothetical protein
VNPHLNALFKGLGDAGVPTNDLRSTLRLIRAHWSLCDICLVAERLIQLSGKYPVLREPVDGRDISAEWAVLRRLAAWRPANPHFRGDTKRRSKLPTHPHTGESGLCEVLLLQPYREASASHRERFDELTAWFAWQVFRFQLRVEDESRYFRYLDSQEPPHSVEKRRASFENIRDGNGQSVYQASLLVRDSGGKDYASAIDSLVQAVGEPDPTASERLALLLRVKRSEPNALTQAAASLKMSDGDVAAAARLVAPDLPVKPKKRKKGAKGAKGAESAEDADDAESTGRTVPGSFGRFIELIWLNQTVRKRPPRPGTERDTLHREVLRPQLERYPGEGTIERFLPIDEPGGTGVAVEISLAGTGNGGGAKRSGKANPPPSDEPDIDDDDPGEPAITFYLSSDARLINAYYGARAAAHRIELANAMLSNASGRLTSGAIAELLAYLERERWVRDQRRRRSVLHAWLMLVSGRPLDQVQRFRVFKYGVPLSNFGGASAEQPVCIDLSSSELLVLVGQPNLAKVPKLTELIRERSDVLRVSIPEDWANFAWEVYKQTDEQPSTLKDLRSLLDELPEHLNITVSAVMQTIRYELLSNPASDVAWIKVITDADVANAANTIHYFSILDGTASVRWQRVLDRWHYDDQVRRRFDSHYWDWKAVGAPESLEPYALAAHIRAVEEAYLSALAKQDICRALNNLAVYVGLWCALATAGRRTTSPIPVWIRADGWALVRDKHRRDESTDRLVKLTDGVREQITFYFALLHALSLTRHDVADRLRESAPGVPLLMFGADGEVQDFEPSWRDPTMSEMPVPPANWARKLLRSDPYELPPRFREAGLGHFMRGRHPWSRLSMFPSATFGKEWVREIAQYENLLGFKVLRYPGLTPSPRALEARWFPISEPIEEATAEPCSPDAVDQAFQRAPAASWRAVFESPTPLPEDALTLAAQTIRGCQLPRDAAIALAEGIAARIRELKNIPLFVAKPRRQFQRDWMVSGRAFALNCWMMEHVVPAMDRDLEAIPALVDTESGRELDLGRLIMVLIWRLGLAHRQHLMAMLRWMADPERPILAVDDARYVQLKVPFAFTQETMSRTVHLNAWAACFIALVRGPLVPDLAALCALPRKRRWARIERAIRVYFDFLGAPTSLTLPDIMQAAIQQIMLASMPVLAAYASGQVQTEDLRDPDLRRLAGYVPKRNLAVERQTEQADARDSDAPEDDETGEPLPAMPRAQTGLDGLFFANDANGLAEQERAIGLQQPQSVAERLLQHFQLYLVVRAARKAAGTNDYRGADGQLIGRWDPRAIASFQSKVRVVAQGLSLSTEPEQTSLAVDEELIRRMAEITELDAPARIHHGAWASFRGFMRDASSAIPDVERGDVQHGGHQVIAKMMSRAEIRRIRRALATARSGVGNHDFRTAALRHFSLQSETGMRRAEVEGLRVIDRQGDYLRVQEYDSHTLKTRSAFRLIPLDMLTEETLKMVDQACADGVIAIVDPRRGLRARGINYFPAINTLIKAQTGDADLSSHILRHSLASELFMTEAAGDVRGELEHVFPWLDREAASWALLALTYRAGGGHALQAIACVMGHLHPSTTLRHYIHTAGLALYAAYGQKQASDLRRSFRSRVTPNNLLDRMTKRIDTAIVDVPEHKRLAKMRESMMCERIEQWAAVAYPQVVGAHHDRSLLKLPDVDQEREGEPLDPLSLNRSRIEQIEQALATTSWPESEPLTRSHILAGLNALALIPSGKRGCATSRHPMPQNSEEGAPMPAILAAHKASDNASQLLRWLNQLRVEKPGRYDELLNLWRHATTAADGLVLIRPENRALVNELGDWSSALGISLKLEEVVVPASRRSSGDRKVAAQRLRILVMKDGQPSRRSGGAVRWVMSWACVVDSAASFGSVANELATRS